jgi:caffeoyl-CoA O-methyltransferase
MTSRTLCLSEPLHAYLLEVSLREPPLLARLRAETETLPLSNMQISPEQGQFMALLVELIGARRTLEIGTFTGYSALCVARALPADGQIVTCDISARYTDIARRYWAEAGVADKIDLRLGPALATLDALLDHGDAEGFDFAFIDADKEHYDGYYDRCLELLRKGGLLAVDNVLWDGAVADPRKQDKNTKAIRALNLRLLQDDRISLSLVPIGDGLALARKR